MNGPDMSRPGKGGHEVTGWDATAWGEYLTTAAALDSARRDEAAAVVAQQEATATARQEIATVRRRIEVQRARLLDAAARASMPRPGVDPGPGDRETAAAMLKAPEPASAADPVAAVAAAVSGASATLDAADAALLAARRRRATVGALPTWPPLLRNGVVYFWFAALTMVALAEISHIAGSSRRADLLVAVFSVLVPACAWVVAWLSIGVLFEPDPDGDQPRSPWLGFLLCAVPLLVGLLLSAR